MEHKIKKIIESYLNGNASEEDMKFLKVFETFAENKIKDSLFSNEKETTDLKDEMFLNIKKQTTTKVRKLVIWRYAAAAVLIGVLATSYFFKDDILNNTLNTTTKIAENNIEIGTSKAILTLENGEQIILEAGTNYKTNFATSNGETLTYTAKSALNTNNKEIAYNYLTIPRGGQFHVTLPDGTQINLNSASKIKYPVAFTNKATREVELVYGEAFFKVSPSTLHQGANFKVLTGTQEVNVLGTEFNIKAYPDEDAIYTTLAEGKVTVSNAFNTKFLTPGHQAITKPDNDKIQTTEISVSDIISWKDGVFSFQNMPLKDITQILSRWYDVDIIFENKALETVAFNGVLEKNQSIEDILSAIKYAAINEYTINDRTIIIR